MGVQIEENLKGGIMEKKRMLQIGLMVVMVVIWVVVFNLVKEQSGSWCNVDIPAAFASDVPEGDGLIIDNFSSDECLISYTSNDCDSTPPEPSLVRVAAVHSDVHPGGIAPNGQRWRYYKVYTKTSDNCGIRDVRLSRLEGTNEIEMKICEGEGCDNDMQGDWRGCKGDSPYLDCNACNPDENNLPILYRGGPTQTIKIEAEDCCQNKATAIYNVSIEMDGKITLRLREISYQAWNFKRPWVFVPADMDTPIYIEGNAETKFTTTTDN